MHEFGYCEGILEAVLNRAAGRPVERVKVRIGTTHRIDQESLDQAFAMVAAGTAAEGAAVDLEVTPVDVACHACGVASTSLDPLPECDSCGSQNVTVTGGHECLLVSIDLVAGGMTPAATDAAAIGS